MPRRVCSKQSIHGFYYYYLKQPSYQVWASGSAGSCVMYSSRDSCDVVQIALQLESGECVEDFGFLHTM